MLNSRHLHCVPVCKEIIQMWRLCPHFSCLTKTCTFHSSAEKKTQRRCERHAVIWMAYLLHRLAGEYSPGVQLPHFPSPNRRDSHTQGSSKQPLERSADAIINSFTVCSIPCPPPHPWTPFFLLLKFTLFSYHLILSPVSPSCLFFFFSVILRILCAA